MLESFELDGVWWLPDSSETKVAGQLKINPENYPTLHLNGQFINEENFKPFILGFTSNGKKITLHRCLRSSQSNSFPGYTVEGYGAVICIIGHHYSDERDISFNKISMSYEGFEGWMGKNLFRTDIDKDVEEKEMVVRGKLPEIIEVNMTDFSIQISYSVNVSSGTYVENIQKTTAWITIDFNDTVGINHIWEYIKNISNFIDLGLGKRTNLLKLKARAEYMTDYPNEVELYYPLYINKEITGLHPFHMVFTYPNISSHFEKYITNWFYFVNRYEPTYDLFFSTFKNPYIHKVDKFLSLVQALESYHNRKYDDDYVMPPDKFTLLSAQIKCVIVNTEPDPLNRDFLVSRMNFWNRKSLRRRLREIYEDNTELFDRFIDDRDDFISKLVDTRNYYTHYGESVKSSLIDEKSLPLYSQKIMWMIVIIILTELEFSKELKISSFENYQKWASIKAIY